MGPWCSDYSGCWFGHNGLTGKGGLSSLINPYSPGAYDICSSVDLIIFIQLRDCLVSVRLHAWHHHVREYAVALYMMDDSCCLGKRGLKHCGVDETP